MRTLFLTTAAFAALVMVAPIGNAHADEIMHVVCMGGDVVTLDMSFKDEGVDLTVGTGNGSALPAEIRNSTIAAITGHDKADPIHGEYAFDDKTNELHAFFKGMKMELFLGLNRPAGAPNRDHYDMIDNRSETTPLLCRKA